MPFWCRKTNLFRTESNVDLCTATRSRSCPPLHLDVRAVTTPTRSRATRSWLKGTYGDQRRLATDSIRELAATMKANGLPLRALEPCYSRCSGIDFLRC